MVVVLPGCFKIHCLTVHAHLPKENLLEIDADPGDTLHFLEVHRWKVLRLHQEPLPRMLTSKTGAEAESGNSN